MLYNYNEAKKWSQKVILFEANEAETQYEGELIDVRINPDTIPKGKFWYHCRHNDEGDWCTPITIEPRVLVNFCGTFITDKEITFPNPYDKYISIKDIDYVGE